MLIPFVCAPASFLLLTVSAVPVLATQKPSKDYPFLGQDNGSLSLEQRGARDALDQGVAAFNNGQYDEAARLFESAKQLDPKLINAPLYLATTYASQYIPGAPSEENTRLGQSAIEEFKGVLRIEQQNLLAIDGLGSIIFQMSGTPFSKEGFLESKSWHQKHIAIQPQDPEPYYWISVINWTLSFHRNAELRQSLNLDAMGPEGAEPLPPGLRGIHARIRADD